MTDGWKLAALKRRRQWLAERLASIRADGKKHHRATKYDQREHDALDWAIGKLDTWSTCEVCSVAGPTVRFSEPHDCYICEECEQ